MRKRRLGRAVSVAAAIVVTIVVLLFALFPAATTAAEGPADPILGLRRVVFEELGHCGIANWGPSRHPWLPSEEQGRVPSLDGERRGQEPIARDRSCCRVVYEPVYRALLFPAGKRVTAEVDLERRTAERFLTLQVCAATGTRWDVVAEDVSPSLTEEGTVRWRARGFVASDADAGGVRLIDRAGRYYFVETWGDVGNGQDDLLWDDVMEDHVRRMLGR